MINCYVIIFKSNFENRKEILRKVDTEHPGKHLVNNISRHTKCLVEHFNEYIYYTNYFQHTNTTCVSLTMCGLTQI